jgi:hypothetical protein
MNIFFLCLNGTLKKNSTVQKPKVRKEEDLNEASVWLLSLLLHQALAKNVPLSSG